MKLLSWEIRDPASLIAEVAEREPLTEDTAYIALVREPSVAQEIVALKRLSLPALLDDDDDISDELRDLARSFGLGWQRRPPQHAFVTVVVRPGRCVLGPNEAVWCLGWRYANHGEPAFDGDLVLVTEHGWLDLMTQEAGHEPRMVAADPTTG